jgi:5-methylcytosine-specific restriction endonuclease McrA
MRAQTDVSTDPRHVVLRRDLFAAAARDRTNTAEFLALIAEFDALRLYVPEGYASMHAFCIGELRMCEESAFKRIQAARAARRFPQLFDALAEGRLHLSAVFLLAPHLTAENVDELVAASTHQSKRAIRDLMTRRFLAPAPILEFAAPTPPTPRLEGSQLEPVPVNVHLAKTTQPNVPQAVGPPRRIDVHCWVDRDKLEHARALLSHCVPTGDLGKVFDRALDAVIREMEKKKFAGTKRPRVPVPRRVSARARHIPAHAKREVWMRDQGRCTFVGSNGHRCEARRFLEFDHARPIALGGESTVDDLRLRCRVHNQYEAERVFGTDFMAEKREAARQARAEARESREATRTQKSTNDDRMRAIASGLRNLGCRADEARHAAESAVGAMPPGATLEDCLRAALRSLRPPRSTHRVEKQRTSSAADTAPAVIVVEEVAV